MYWYYFQSARGIRIWWKQYITIMQIIQFVLDLGKHTTSHSTQYAKPLTAPTGFVYFASWTYFTSTYFPHLANAGECAGEEFAAIAGIAILSSYLLLFISFYFATYKKPVKKGRGRASSALIEMKDEQVPTVGQARRRFSGSGPGLSSGRATTIEANGHNTRSRKA